MGSVANTPFPAAAMQTGRKRKSSALLPNMPQAVGAQGPAEPQTLHRRLRSHSASLVAAVVEEQPDSAPAAVATPKRAKRKAKSEPAAPAQQPVPLPQPLLAVGRPVLVEVLPTWTRERLSAAAEHLRRVDSSAHAGCCCVLDRLVFTHICLCTLAIKPRLCTLAIKPFLGITEVVLWVFLFRSVCVLLPGCGSRRQASAGLPSAVT